MRRIGASCITSAGYDWWNVIHDRMIIIIVRMIKKVYTMLG